MNADRISRAVPAGRAAPRAPAAPAASAAPARRAPPIGRDAASHRPAPGSPLVTATAGLACLLGAVLLRGWLESTMLTHMLLQLPLLLAAGWLIAHGRGAIAATAGIDQHGVTGLTALLFVSAYWMIPRTLELSITDPLTTGAKFVSLFLLGAMLPGALRRANWIVQLFYLGNFSWMTAIAGIQYQTLPQRLCNAYLLDDQAQTGVALVAAAVVVALLWCWRLAPAILGKTASPVTGADAP